MDFKDVTISPWKGKLIIKTLGLTVKERNPKKYERYPLT